jgi:ribosomal protein S18 acetylase RimI-like enzyme
MFALDNPAWLALGGRQAGLGMGAGAARRFRPEFSPMGGLADPEAQDLGPQFADLAGLDAGGDVTALVLPREVTIPAGWKETVNVPVPQFVHDGRRLAEPNFDIAELGPGDAPEMLALATLTEPGPFRLRTGELGTYLGVRREGKLVAMAGERLQPPGFTEVSAVCTHPSATGQGLARGLVAAVVGRIQARGETAFLHVRPENARAIAIYELLGFRRRREIRIQVVRPEK